MNSEFGRRFEALGLRHFRPAEFLTLGGAHYAHGHRAYGLNTTPPKRVWGELFKVARVCDAVREEVGQPVKVISAYRTIQYNTAIGGAPRSQHMEGAAADIVSPAGASSLYRAAVRLRARDVFSGGIGRYDTFVHVDVRGSYADWDYRK